MYALLIYSLKVGACLAVFYLFFKLLLSRETFHRLNRAVVLGALLLSFVLPLCVITVYREAPVLPEIRPALLAAAAEAAFLQEILKEQNLQSFPVRSFPGHLNASSLQVSM